MIRYAIDPAECDRRIERQHAGWRATARNWTREMDKQGAFAECDQCAWSLIKLVFMRLQHFKCAFCERQLPLPDHLKAAPDRDLVYGLSEHDVEHFRPKSRVRAWPNAETRAQLSQFDLGFLDDRGADTGYYRLAYHPGNYAIACKRCNSGLKGDCFPILGRRKLKGSDPWAMASEKPLLIYPIGTLDADPADLITFRGVQPVPVARSGHKHRRAIATIAFFRLHGEDLSIERARILRPIHLALEVCRAGAPADLVLEAREVVKDAQSPTMPHSRCTRAFVELYQRDRAAAGILSTEARDLIRSLDRKAPGQ